MVESVIFTLVIQIVDVVATVLLNVNVSVYVPDTGMMIGILNGVYGTEDELTANVIPLTSVTFPIETLSV